MDARGCVRPSGRAGGFAGLGGKPRAGCEVAGVPGRGPEFGGLRARQGDVNGCYIA